MAKRTQKGPMHDHEIQANPQATGELEEWVHLKNPCTVSCLHSPVKMTVAQ